MGSGSGIGGSGGGGSMGAGSGSEAITDPRPLLSVGGTMARVTLLAVSADTPPHDGR